MLKKVIYSNNGGMGLISNVGPYHPKIVQEKVVLHGKELKPGEETVLDGFFKSEVIYVGTLESKNHKVMCFYAGKKADLFEENHYYYCLVYLDENNILNKYTYSSARSFIWNGSQWK
jgi:hypothetical protein